MNKKTITIIGSGMMGSALAFPARENGNEVNIVGTHLDRAIIDNAKVNNRHLKFDRDFPEGINFYQIEELDKALENVDFIICGVSSFGVDWWKDYILPKLPENVPVISVTKGLMNLEDGKLITYLDIWQEKLAELNKNIPLCAIGGPCTSYELVSHDQTLVHFCGKNSDALKMIKSAMETDYYHIGLTNDVVGVESAVALKNGYALGVALTIGLNQKNFGNDTLHFNSQAAVFTEAAKEMKKLLDLQNAGSLDNLALGIGDLYVTVYGGRTRLVGILLGKGLSIDEAKKELNGVTLESLVVAERVAKALKVKAEKGEADLKDFPLLLHIDEIITDKLSVNIPWNSFVKEF